MDYQPLNKLYYKGIDIYNETLAKRLGNPDSVYMLPVSIKSNPAFIVISHEVLSLVQKIYIRNNKLTRLYGRLPRGVIGSYLNKSLVEEILQSNEIEGVFSTRKELHMVLKNESCPKKLRFKGLVTKYNKILEGEEIPLKNSRDIRSLYDEIILPEIEKENFPDGEIFRRGLVSVYSGTQKELHRGILPEKKLIEFMDQSLQWLQNGDIPQILRIAAFHYLFGYMHPFYDGNGRLSRFITSYLLRDTLNFLVSLRISYTISDQRKAYLDAFELANDEKNKGDLTPFTIYFLEMIYTAIDGLVKALEDSENKLAYYNKLLEDNCSDLDGPLKDILFILIQSTVFAEKPMSIAELRQNLSRYSKSWMHKKMEILESKSYVKKEREGRSFLYYANLEALDSFAE